MNPILSKLLALLAPPRRMEYVVTDKNLNIIDISWEVQRFAESPDRISKGSDVRLAFPEIIGCEDIVSDLFQGKRMSFELKGIARSLDLSQPLFIDICMVADQDDQSWEKKLIILFEDVTEKMLFQQNLVQRANETSLLANALFEAKKYTDKIMAAMTEVLLITSTTGNIRKINQAAQVLFGYREWELVNKPITTIIVDDRFSLLMSDRLVTDILFKNEQLVCHNKAGEIIYVAFSCSVIETDMEEYPDFLYVGREYHHHHQYIN